MILNNSGFSNTIARYGIEYHMFISAKSSDAGISRTLGRKYLEQWDDTIVAGIKIVIRYNDSRAEILLDDEASHLLALVFCSVWVRHDQLIRAIHVSIETKLYMPQFICQQII